MPVTTLPARKQYAGNGVTTVFATTFKFLANADLKVYENDTLKTITTHYTVSGAGVAGGGDVTFVVAPANGVIVTLDRDMVDDQQTDLVNGDGFNQDSVEAMLDKRTMISQELADLFSRCIQFPNTEIVTSSPALPSKATRAGKVLGFDALGDLSVTPIGTIAVTDGTITAAKLATDAVETAKIKDKNVTLAKIQDISNGRILGRASDVAAGVVTELTLGANMFAVGGALIALPPGLRSQWNDLKVKSASASTLTIDASRIIVWDAAGTFNVLLPAPATITVDITVAGVNGLDAGSEANSTWYYIHVIYNGTLVRGLLSTSSTSPTMPGGYTYRELVGVVRNDGSGNFISFFQHDSEVFVSEQAVFTATAGVTSWTSLSLASFIPPNARFVRGNRGHTAGNYGALDVASDSGGLIGVSRGRAYWGGGSATDTFFDALPFMVPIQTAQTVYWKAHNTVADNRLAVTGYTL